MNKTEVFRDAAGEQVLPGMFFLYAAHFGHDSFLKYGIAVDSTEEELCSFTTGTRCIRVPAKMSRIIRSHRVFAIPSTYVPEEARDLLWAAYYRGK